MVAAARAAALAEVVRIALRIAAGGVARDGGIGCVTDGTIDRAGRRASYQEARKARTNGSTTRATLSGAACSSWNGMKRSQRRSRRTSKQSTRGW